MSVWRRKAIECMPAAMPRWVKRSRYYHIRRLLQERLTADQMLEPDKLYK